MPKSQCKDSMPKSQCVGVHALSHGCVPRLCTLALWPWLHDLALGKILIALSLRLCSASWLSYFDPSTKLKILLLIDAIHSSFWKLSTVLLN